MLPQPISRPMSISMPYWRGTPQQVVGAWQRRRRLISTFWLVGILATLGWLIYSIATYDPTEELIRQAIASRGRHITTGDSSQDGVLALCGLLIAVFGVGFVATRHFSGVGSNTFQLHTHGIRLGLKGNWNLEHPLPELAEPHFHLRQTWRDALDHRTSPLNLPYLSTLTVQLPGQPEPQMFTFLIDSPKERRALNLILEQWQVQGAAVRVTEE